MAAALVGWIAVNRPGFAVAIMAVVIGLAVLSLAHISTGAGVLGFVVFSQLVVGQLYITGQLPETLTVVSDAITVVLFAVAVMQPTKSARAAHSVVLVFLALVAVHAVNPQLPSLDFGLRGARLLAMSMLILIIAKQIPLTERDRKFVLGALAAGWIVNLLIGYRQWILDFTPAELAWIEDADATYAVDQQIRLMGAMQSNQDFGLLAALMMAPVAVAAFAARRTAWRYAGAALLCLGAAILFGTLLRSALVGGVLGAVAAVAAVTVTSHDRNRVAVIGALVTLGLWAFATIGSQTFLKAEQSSTVQSRTTSIFAPTQDASFQQRQTQVWPKALRVIREHPLGGGAGSAGAISQQQPTVAPFGRLVPDNGYLYITVQTGVVGLGVFLGMLFLLLATSWRRARGGNRYAAAGVGAIIAMMLSMIAGSYWGLIAPAVIFGLIVGLGLRDDPTPAAAE